MTAPVMQGPPAVRPHHRPAVAHPRRHPSLALRIVLVVLGALLCFVVGWGLWAAAAFARYGHATVLSPAAGGDSLLPHWIPAPEVVDRHEAIVEAPASVVFAAALRFELQESPVVRAIFATRERMIGARDTAPLPSRPFLDEIRSMGWGALGEVPGREVVFGAVTRPWEQQVVFHAIPPERFAAFDSAGYVKIAWTLAVDSLSPTRSRVSTETRVATTDAESRTKFRRYWSIFSPGISLIRHEALRIVRREAEHGR